MSDIQAVTDPLVSVLMTSYNREKFIGEAIESVLASTFSNFELIIVDDASVDHTFSIAQEFAAKDERVRLFRNEYNLGQFRNRNKAASLAVGIYIMYADSDDMLYPDAIERCVAAMLSFPEAGFAMYSSFKDGKIKMLPPAVSIRKHFFEKPFLTHGPGATVIKRKVFYEIGGFPHAYSIAGDMYYNLNAASHTSIVLLPFRFVHYRLHEGQELNNSFDYLWANFNYLRDALETLPLTLNDKEKNWLMNKNRRRFVVNIIRYFFHSIDIKGIFKLVRKTNFGFLDLFKAIVH